MGLPPGDGLGGTAVLARTKSKAKKKKERTSGADFASLYG
eukprot:COSAG05_NODE_2137_length_3497_cov_1.466451_5_plen_40_part_00